MSSLFIRGLGRCVGLLEKQQTFLSVKWARLVENSLWPDSFDLCCGPIITLSHIRNHDDLYLDFYGHDPTLLEILRVV